MAVAVKYAAETFGQITHAHTNAVYILRHAEHLASVAVAARHSHGQFHPFGCVADQVRIVLGTGADKRLIAGNGSSDGNRRVDHIYRQLQVISVGLPFPIDQTPINIHGGIDYTEAVRNIQMETVGSIRTIRTIRSRTNDIINQKDVARIIGSKVTGGIDDRVRIVNGDGQARRSAADRNQTASHTAVPTIGVLNSTAPGSGWGRTTIPYQVRSASITTN